MFFCRLSRLYLLWTLVYSPMAWAARGIVETEWLVYSECSCPVLQKNPVPHIDVSDMPDWNSSAKTDRPWKLRDRNTRAVDTSKLTNQVSKLWKQWMQKHFILYRHAEKGPEWQRATRVFLECTPRRKEKCVKSFGKNYRNFEKTTYSLSQSAQILVLIAFTCIDNEWMYVSVN